MRLLRSLTPPTLRKQGRASTGGESSMLHLLSPGLAKLLRLRLCVHCLVPRFCTHPRKDGVRVHSVDSQDVVWAAAHQGRALRLCEGMEARAFILCDFIRLDPARLIDRVGNSTWN